MRHFVVVCQQALASGEFLLDDLPGSSGRLDVGLRCVRAALLVSHGLRRDAVVYIVLGGGARAPRTVRIRGADVRFLRPDERSLSVLVQKVLASRADEAPGFVEVKAGIALASDGLEAVIADLGATAKYVLDENAPDLRDEVALGADAAFFVGDHTGFGEATRGRLAAVGARPLGAGPVSLHAEDAIAIVQGELDRRRADGANGAARVGPPGAAPGRPRSEASR
jgi:tRNA (pseudouridine54-N1)-methyltransferase